jgi:short-subunit dehydrogenase
MPRPNYEAPFKNIYHKKPYAAIDPSQPSLAAHEKTVLITAGHTGIGFAIAQNFAIAGASNIILLARRADVLERAVKGLSSAHIKTKFCYFTASIDDPLRVKEVFSEIRSTIADVDILVTSAAYVASFSDVLTLPTEQLRATFETNVFGNINLVKEFLFRIPAIESGKEQIILDVSSAAAHLDSPNLGAYSVSKMAFTRWLEHLHGELEGKAVRVHSYHPGGVYTEAAKGFGMKENSLPWNDVQLPGQFSVWLASKEAAFLNGRFVWANWDVEELKAQKTKIESDPHLLTLGMVSD